MIDPKLLREQPDLLKAACKNKNVVLDIDAIIALDARRRELGAEVDELNRQRNEAAKEKDIAKGKELKEKAGEKEKMLAEINDEIAPLLLKIPNIPSDDTPVGADESGNVVLRQVGTIPTFDFEVKDHVVIGEMHGWIDNEKAADVSGARFSYMKGALVELERAVINFTIDVLTDQAALEHVISTQGLKVASTPFTLVSPPLMIRPEVMARMARLEPKDERYHIDSDDLYLIGSAEHTLGPMHMDETLKEAQLPIRYAAFTAAFRREAGSYGKDTRGLIRVHQFNKLEMESFTTAEQGIEEQNFLVAIQEHLMQQLGLPYQVLMCCTGDQGDPDARHIDIETWMPGQGKYRETHSADYMTDYQSRRLATKVKREKGNKLVHMNDATAIAGRTLIAILENYQRADGSVTVPDVLRPYLKGKDVLN